LARSSLPGAGVRSFVAIVIVVAAFGAGCAGEADPCAPAAAHVAECRGEAPDQAPGACDEDRADELLAMDCDQLAAAEATGKADGWWDALLCLLGFSSHCDGAPAPPAAPPAQPATRTLAGHVYKLSSGTPADGVYVKATRIVDGDGDGGGGQDWRYRWTVGGGLFVIEGLPTGRYRVDVALAGGAPALATREVDLARQQYLAIYAPVP